MAVRSVLRIAGFCRDFVPVGRHLRTLVKPWTFHVYVREVADASAPVDAPVRMAAEFGGALRVALVRATRQIDLHERANRRRSPQEWGAGGIHRSVAGIPSGRSRRICSITLASISTAPRVRVRVEGSRINPA
jgi:hypothetical protein